MPAFAAPYCPVFGLGAAPLREEMLTIEPPPVVAIDFAAAWQAKNVHFRFRSTTLSQLDSVRSMSGPTSSALALPALLTQHPTRPNSFTVTSIRLATSSGLVM